MATFELFRRAPMGRLKTRLAGLCRVTGYLTFVSVVSSFFLLRAADAQMSEAVQRFGDSLVKQLGPDLVGETQQLLVNGQSVFFASAVVAQDLGPTLDVLEQHCKDQSSPALASFGKLPAVIRGEPVSAELRDPVRWAIDRYDTEDRAAGQVACIAHPQDSADLSATLERVFRFVDSGDLAEVGNARYFLARRVGEKSTQVLSIWTEGKFELLNLFPTEGDAPGGDSELAPRPPLARRTFSAVVPGRRYQVRVYESAAQRQAILAHYDETLTSEGWVDRPLSDTDDLRVLGRAFSRSDQLLFIVLDSERDGETPVTLVEVGGEGFVEPAAAVRGMAAKKNTD